MASGDVTLQQYKFNVANQMRGSSVPQHERLWSSNPSVSEQESDDIPQLYSGELPEQQQRHQQPQQFAFPGSLLDPQRPAGHLTSSDQFQQELLRWQQHPKQLQQQQLQQQHQVQLQAQARQLQAYQDNTYQPQTVQQHQPGLRQSQQQAQQQATSVDTQHLSHYPQTQHQQQLGSTHLPLGTLPHSVQVNAPLDQQHTGGLPHSAPVSGAMQQQQQQQQQAGLQGQQGLQQAYLQRPASASPHALQHHTPLTYPSDDPALRPRPANHLGGMPQTLPHQQQPYPSPTPAAPAPYNALMQPPPPPPPPPGQSPSQSHHAMQLQQQQHQAGQMARSGLSPPASSAAQANLSLLQQRLRARQQAAIQAGRLPPPQQQLQQQPTAPGGLPFTGSGDLGPLPGQHQQPNLLDLTLPPAPRQQVPYPQHQQQQHHATAATAYLGPAQQQLLQRQQQQLPGQQHQQQRRMLPSDALFQQGALHRNGGLLPSSDPLMGARPGQGGPSGLAGGRPEAALFLAGGGSSGSGGEEELEMLLARQVGTGGGVDMMLTRQEEDLLLSRQVGGLDAGNAALDAALRQRPRAPDAGHWPLPQHGQQQPPPPPQQPGLALQQGYGAGGAGGAGVQGMRMMADGAGARPLPPAAQHNANRAMLAAAMQQLQREQHQQQQLQRQDHHARAMPHQVQPPPPPPPQDTQQQQYMYRQLAAQHQQHQQQGGPGVANEFANLLHQHQQLHQNQHQHQLQQAPGGRSPYDHLPVNARAASTSQIHWTPPPPPPPYPRTSMTSALSSLSYPPPPGVSRTRGPNGGGLSAAPSADGLPHYHHDLDRAPPPAPPPRQQPPPSQVNATFAVISAPSANDQQLADLLAQMPSTAAAPASHCTITTGVPGAPPPPPTANSGRSVETAARTASSDSVPAVSGDATAQDSSGSAAAGGQKRAAKRPSPFTVGPTPEAPGGAPGAGQAVGGAGPAAGAGDAAEEDLPELLSSLKLSGGHQPLPLLQKPDLQAGSQEDVAKDQQQAVQLQAPHAMASMPSSLAASSWDLSPTPTHDPLVPQLPSSGACPASSGAYPASSGAYPASSAPLLSEPTVMLPQQQQQPLPPRATHQTLPQQHQPLPPQHQPLPASSPLHGGNSAGNHAMPGGRLTQGDLPSLPGSSMSMSLLADLPSGLSLPAPGSYLDSFPLVMPQAAFHQPPPPPPPRERSNPMAAAAGSPASHPLRASVTALSSGELPAASPPAPAAVLQDDYLNPVEPLPSPFLQPSPSSSSDPHASPLPSSGDGGPPDDIDSLTLLRKSLAPPRATPPHSDVDSSQSPFNQHSAPLACLPDLHEELEHPSRRTVDSLFTSLAGYTVATPALDGSLPSFQQLHDAKAALGHSTLPPALASVPEAPDSSPNALLAASLAAHAQQQQQQMSLELAMQEQQQQMGGAGAEQHLMGPGAGMGMEPVGLHIMAKRRNEMSLRLGDRDSLTYVKPLPKRPAMLPPQTGGGAMAGVGHGLHSDGYSDSSSGDQWGLRDQSVHLGAMGR